MAAVRGVLASLLGMIKEGATHIAVATDHVIESFRNELWPGYKTAQGVEPELLAQFPLLEETLTAAGIVVWPMVEFEADDALAAAAACGRSRCACRTCDHLHPGQGPRPMCKRHSHRPTESPDSSNLGPGWGDPEVRRLAGVDPRLSGARRRCSRRLSRPRRMGREVVGRGPCQVCPSRIHPSGLSGMAGERRQCQRPRRHSFPRAGPCLAYSGCSPPFEATSLSSTTWTSCAGTALQPPSTNSQLGWMQGVSKHGSPRHVVPRVRRLSAVR